MSFQADILATKREAMLSRYFNHAAFEQLVAGVEQRIPMCAPLPREVQEVMAAMSVCPQCGRVASGLMCDPKADAVGRYYACITCIMQIQSIPLS